MRLSSTNRIRASPTSTPVTTWNATSASRAEKSREEGGGMEACSSHLALCVVVVELCYVPLPFGVDVPQKIPAPILAVPPIITSWRVWLEKGPQLYEVSPLLFVRGKQALGISTSSKLSAGLHHSGGAGRGRKLVGRNPVNLIVGWCGRFWRDRRAPDPSQFIVFVSSFSNPLKRPHSISTSKLILAHRRGRRTCLLRPQTTS